MSVVESPEIEREAAAFERRVCETFDVEPEDIEISVAERQRAERNLVTFEARWVV